MDAGQSLALEQIVEILRPLRDASELYYENDPVGLDNKIRHVIKCAMKELDIDGLGGCRLCLS